MYLSLYTAICNKIKIKCHYLRLFRAPRAVVLLVDVLLWSLVVAATRLDPVVLAGGAVAIVFDDIPDAVVAAVAGIVVVDDVVNVFPLLFDVVPLFISTDDDDDDVDDVDDAV